MLVDLKNVTKSYRAAAGTDQVDVFRALDLSVSEGERIALLGPSGSGKSTVLNIIGALDRADSGQVTVAGQNLGQLEGDDLARFRNETVGFVFQLHHLLPQCTILENVLIPTLARPRRDHAALQERAAELLGSVGLTHRLRHRPGQLSGGERQRVAVARALINHPKLLLADEPTGALDRASASSLVDLMIDVNTRAGVTLVVVTHALEVAQRMQRVMQFADGKLVGKNGGVP
jgi:ABC-type lipoprotein export system ATPase subunit